MTTAPPPALIWLPSADYLPLIPEWSEGPTVLFAWKNARDEWDYGVGCVWFWDRQDNEFPPRFQVGEWDVPASHFAFLTPPQS